MKPDRRLAGMAIALVALGAPFASSAAEGDGWAWMLEPYVWAASIGTDMRTYQPPTEGGSDSSFSDIVDKLDGVFMARVEARNDRFAATVSSVVLVGNPLRDSTSTAVTRDPGLAAVNATGLTRYANGPVVVRPAWAGKVADFCYARDQICALPPATGAVVARVASTGQYSAAAAATYRQISWSEHSAYPASFRTAILARF